MTSLKSLLCNTRSSLTTKDVMELEAQRKEGERQEEEVAKELRRFTMQEVARGFSLSEGALLVSETHDPNIEQSVKGAAAVQNAIQCYCVIMARKKRATTQTPLRLCFQEDRWN